MVRIHRIECRLLGALVSGGQGALQLARQFLSSSFAFGQGFAPTLFGRIGLHDFRRDVGGHVLDGLKHRDAFAQTLFELRQFLRAEIGECFLQPLDAFARGFDFLADAVDDGRLVFGAGDRLRTGSVAIGHAGRFADDAFLAACGLIDLVALAHGVGQEFSRCDHGQSDAGRSQGGFDADRGGARCGHHSGEGGAGGGAQGHECRAGTGHACGHGGHGGGKLRGGCDHRLADAELEGHRGGAHADKDRQKRAQAGHQLDQCRGGLARRLAKAGKVGLGKAFKDIKARDLRHEAHEKLVDLQPHGLDRIADRIKPGGIGFEYIAQLADLIGCGGERRRVAHEGEHFHA